MSSILEALEKSERERNQNNIERYPNMLPPTEKTSSLKYIVFTIIGLALLVGLYFLVTTINWSNLFDSNPSQNKVLERPLIDSVNSTKTEDSGRFSVKGSAADTLINYSDLKDSEKEALPDQPINVVSVSPNKERSFLMFGDKMYREGNNLGKGAILEEIHKDHIIIKYKQHLIKRNLD